MAGFIKFVWRLSNVMYFFAGVVLSFMMLLTGADVILRYLGMPIPGTYEMVGLLGAIVIGFAIPHTSLVRGHVYVEFLVDRFEKGRREVVLIFTKILVLFFFIVLAINLYKIGVNSCANGEVTDILRIPFYPIIYAIGVCCFIECLVMVCDIKKLVGGEYE